MELMHETKISSLSQILHTKVLFKSSEIRARNLSIGQGCFNKRLLSTDPTISIDNNNIEYDEVDGVYFRLTNTITPKILYGDCLLIFPMNILNTYDKFVINTTENHGFCINRDGIMSDSQFSGEPGITITNCKNLSLLQNIDFDIASSEVVIMDNVKLDNLKSVFIKKQSISREIISECRYFNVKVIII